MARFKYLVCLLIASCVAICSSTVQAGMPLWTFTPLTATTISLAVNSSATVQYLVKNQSKKQHTLVLRPIQGVTQTSGPGVCANPFVLAGNASCVLSLQINGANINPPINDGPIVCEQGSAMQCYRPAQADILRVTRAPSANLADISISGSSALVLTMNGAPELFTIVNNTSNVTANNIVPNIAGTALDGNVSVSGNTCAMLAPNATCTITFVPGSTLVPVTSFTIQGDNTNVLTASIAIESGASLVSVAPTSGSASGGTGVTITGAGLTGATSVTFGGVAATSVNVVNSSTITAVTPAHAAGVVDIFVSTPVGDATLTNAYTYVATAVGQSVAGGTVACLGGGLQNLIAASADNSIGIAWGGTGTVTNAQSDTDGSTNTATIVAALGGGAYAAQLCNNYEVDSQGNTPCEAGNACYSDWYLPARNQLNCLYTNRVAIGGFSSDNYWTSTESSGVPALSAWVQLFMNGAQGINAKSGLTSIRCVRGFTP